MQQQSLNRTINLPGLQVRKTTFTVSQGMGRLLQLTHPWASFPFISLGLGMTACIMALVPQVEELMQYDKAAIVCREAWRLLTGHWMH